MRSFPKNEKEAVIVAETKTNEKVPLSETRSFYWCNFLCGLVIIAAMLFMPAPSMLGKTGSISLWVLIPGVFAPVIPGVMFVFSGENFLVSVAVIGVFLYSAFLVVSDFVSEATWRANLVQVARYARDEGAREMAEYDLAHEKSSNFLMSIARIWSVLSGGLFVLVTRMISDSHQR